MTYFITGTDTNVGKTVASAWLVNQLKATYWKPIQSGTLDGRDCDTVKNLSSCPEESIIASCYELRAPLSPHQAAKLEDITIDIEYILATYKALPNKNRLIIEGAGGLMVPLNANQLMIDLIQALKVPVILVARTSLGTLNHTLLSVEALTNRAIPIMGIIAVGKDNPENLFSLEYYSGTHIIAHLPFLSPLNSSQLTTIQPKRKLC
ncbi:dethiobiotin synthase [Candidatus Odyssella thessalonicensis]|uniref:dethiobiotin synthase n=1 Tax=Candidatus Odyssella thessalonicensis TaxID=84647 RepID=UPI000225AEF9|nr:dethiobiotin synthase [Candidatus Odyssella thessalonicensis]